MKYYKGWTTLPLEKYVPAVSAKAFAVTVAGGYTTAKDTYAWLPKSQVIIGEPNECGNAEILVPTWLLKNKRIDPHRIRELNLYEVVEK